MKKGRISLRRHLAPPTDETLALAGLKKIEPLWMGFDNDDDLMRQFEFEDMDGHRVLFAWYGGGSYDGSAHIITHKDEKLYEVNGGHCSCNGLEGQWGPELTFTASLRKKGESPYHFEDDKEARVAYAALLDQLEAITGPLGIQ